MKNRLTFKPSLDIMTNAWSLLYDELQMDENTLNIDMTDMIPNSPATPWKYNEEEIVKELLEYIRGTYNQHYSAGDQKIQTLDLIEACGDGEAFCRSNIPVSYTHLTLPTICSV